MGQDVTYAFGAFRLETATRLLWHEEAFVTLQPKIYRLLLYFLQHPGRLLSREEIFEAVWHGIVVEDTSLRLAVNILRQTLRDEIKTPRYILTVSRHGYRFLPEVIVEYGSERKKMTSHAAGLCYRPVYAIPEILWEYQDELTALLDVFDRADGGGRSLVLLKGKRSAGKTILLENFLASIGRKEFGILRARCLQLGGATEPFLPFLEALERRCLEPGGKFLIDYLNQIAPTWLYQMLNVLDTEELTALQPKVSQINSGRMLREGADFFEAMSRDAVFILMLDNSHWSDQFTLDLLNLLVSRCSPAKLLIIISYRPDENGSGVARIEEMRDELSHRGLCREFSLEKA